MRNRDGRNGRSDDGSALILVLVLMVVGSLIILPLMDFAMTVGRANTVLSVKTARTEAVKAGLRLALADTAGLYATCENGQADFGIDLPVSGLDVPVKTECFLIDKAVSLANSQVRFGLAAVQTGQPVPGGMLSPGYVSDPLSTSKWFLSDSSPLSALDKIWLPNLPTHGLSPRSPVGWPMPEPRFAKCRVFFPGTYPNAVTLDGPTYFASGIYYFEDTVLITGGADVVVGGGLVPGCTTDQYAAFYATGAPSTHNINGLGATFVFGKTGRLVVSNAAGPAIKARFNKRYVPANDPGVAPSAGVNIVSVNGKLSADPLTDENLLIPTVLEVPVSLVGELSGPAKPQKYLPSTLVPPSVPDPPTLPVATGYQNSIRVSWTLPLADGGSAITKYTVRVATPVGDPAFCETFSTTACVVPGLLPLTSYTFTVEATNAVGTSALSGPSAVAQPTTGTPAAPTWSPGTAPVGTTANATPVIDFDLATATLVEVVVPGYVSIPQGRIRVLNPNGHPVTLNGGVLAASMEINYPPPALGGPVPIGLLNAMTQGTFRIRTETVSGSPRMVSNAIVQINEGGPYEINSWEVQAIYT